MTRERKRGESVRKGEERGKRKEEKGWGQGGKRKMRGRRKERGRKGNMESRCYFLMHSPVLMGKITADNCWLWLLHLLFSSLGVAFCVFFSAPLRCSLLQEDGK